MSQDKTAKDKTPAPAGDSKPDFIHEVNEELRQKQLEAFWAENRNWIIGAVILAILTTGGITYWRTWNYKTNLAQTSRLLEISDAGAPKELVDFAKEGKKSHAALARFLAAGLHVQEGNSEEAVKIYGEIAGTMGLDRSLRDLARILSLNQRLDKDDPKKLHREIADLSGAKSSYRYTALELDALLYAREGDMKKASEKLQAIAASPAAPEDERMRAMTLAEFYSASAAEEGEKGEKGRKDKKK